MSSWEESEYWVAFFMELKSGRNIERVKWNSDGSGTVFNKFYKKTIISLRA